MFGTSFDTSADKFQNYYKDLSAAAEEPRDRPGDRRQHVPHWLRRDDAQHSVRRQEPASHGLIQAYSRTNRILNSVKTYGNIVSLPRPRGRDQRRHRAVRQQGRHGHRAAQALRRLLRRVRRAGQPSCWTKFPLGQPIIGEAAQKEFIALFGPILRLQNILTSFDEFAGNEILTERQSQDYRSVYLDLYAEFRKENDRREGVDQRRRRLRDRAHQAGRDQRRLHPHARSEVA